jgi:hypothetical protein
VPAQHVELVALARRQLDRHRLASCHPRFVSAVVVEDHVKSPYRRHGELDGVEEAQEFLLAVTLRAAREHGPFEHAFSSALIIMQ